MPTTDLRGHRVPTSLESPSRKGWVLDPLMSVRDPMPVANVTARAQRVVDLAAAVPPVVPSPAEPFFFWRADAGDGLELEVTSDGSTFRTIPAAPEWVTYSPAWTNLTVGNGTVLARYVRHGRTVHVSVTLTLGSTSAIAAQAYVSLPVGPGAGTVTHTVLGSVGVLDTSAGAFRAGVAFRSGSTARLMLADGSGVSAATPWAWAAGDVISVALTYEGV